LGGNPKTRPHFITYVWNKYLNESRTVQKFENLLSPDTTVIMIDKAMRCDEPPYEGSARPFPDFSRLKAKPKQYTTRHSLGFNALFCDAHVDSFKYKFAYTQSNQEAGNDGGMQGTYNKPGVFVLNPFGIAN